MLKLPLGFGGISMDLYVCGALATQDGDKQGVFRDTHITAMGLLVVRLRYSSIPGGEDAMLSCLTFSLCSPLANAATWNWHWNSNPI